MGNRTIYGSRRGSRSGVRPEPSPFSSSRASEGSSDAAEQGGTPDVVYESLDVAAMRRLSRDLARVLQTALSHVRVEDVGYEELRDAVKPAIDLLWRVK